MLKIGEVSAKTGVSIRSLRHYDEIGLLKPSGHSEAGYRLYSEADIYRLQQIVSLKQMKLPLEKIKTMLANDALPPSGGRASLPYFLKYLFKNSMRFSWAKALPA